MRRHNPVVRLLRRRNGVRRHQPFREEPVLEVAEVFRLDVVGQLFEGQQPVLRVKFVITQDEPSMEESYPLELPALEVPDPELPPAAWARRIFQAVFEGDQEAMIYLQDQYRLGPQGDLQRALQRWAHLDSRAWVQNSPQRWFVFWALLLANASFVGVDREEVTLHTETVRHLVDQYPEQVLRLGPYITDFCQVLLVFAWCLDQTTPHPLG